MAAEVADGPTLDALPYVDPYSAEARAEAERLIQEEMRRFLPGNYLRPYPAPVVKFSSPLLQAEYERVFQGKPLKPFDLTRYKVLPPPANMAHDVQAWSDALDNARAQLEHQLARLVNLELLQTYGPNAHVQANARLQELKARLTARLEACRRDLEALNKTRKAEQLAAGGQLRALAARWDELAAKNVEIQLACAYLEEEIAQLRPA